MPKPAAPTAALTVYELKEVHSVSPFGAPFLRPSFPAGCAAVTAIAHMGATLWKIDEAPTIDIAIARSLSDSFLNWLEASAALHGLEAVGFSSKV